MVYVPAARTLVVVAWRAAAAACTARTMGHYARSYSTTPASVNSLLQGKVSLEASKALQERYQSLQTPQQRRLFCLELADTATTHLPAATAAAQKALAAEKACLTDMLKLRQALTPAYEAWFSQVLSMEGGLRFLFTLRSDILAAAKADPHPALTPLVCTLTALLQTWVHPGWVRLRTITCEDDPRVVQTVMANDKVHAIPTTAALQLRCAPTPQRRLYGFFHPLVVEPLIFVEVALMPDVTARMAAILPYPTDLKLGDAQPIYTPSQPRCAIFYSINTTDVNPALPGLDLGNLLIKTVAAKLKAEGIEEFSTLSPIPGFCKWLDKQAAREGRETPAPAVQQLVLQSPAVMRALTAAATLAKVPLGGNSSSPLVALKAVLDTVPQWWQDDALRAQVEVPLSALALAYLYFSKDSKGRPLDPVSNFHLKNGAQLHRLNLHGDYSPARVRESAGLMVNYYYDLRRVGRHSEGFQSKGTVAVGDPLRALASELNVPL